MKGEIKLYLGICVIISALLLYQKSGIISKHNTSITEVNTLEAFNQLLVDAECNLFLIEGQEEGILLEGSVNRLTQLETNFSYGCITVRDKSKKLMSEIRDFFTGDKDELNIYITVNDIEQLTPIIHKPFSK